MNDDELILAFIGAGWEEKAFWTQDYFVDHELVHLLALAVAVLIVGYLFVLIMNAWVQRSDAPVPRLHLVLPALMAAAAFLIGLGADWLDVCSTYDELEAEMVERGLRR